MCWLFSGIVLSREGYYTIPSMEDLGNMVDDNGECIVDGFTIGRKGGEFLYRNVYWAPRNSSTP